jgi:hypothetical protein
LLQDKLFAAVINAWKLCLGLLVTSTFCLAQTAILPLSEIRPGMSGVGKTVFSGSTLEEFQVEVLGVIEPQDSRSFWRGSAVDHWSDPA